MSSANDLSNQAQSLLGSEFNANPLGDPKQMVNNILTQLSPSDPISILQLAASDPNDLTNAVLLSSITQNINVFILQGLQNEVNSLQNSVDAQIQVIQSQMDSLVQQQANLAVLLQVVQNLIAANQPQQLQQANQQVLNLIQ